MIAEKPNYRMKTAGVITIFLFLATNHCLSQSEPFRGANIIEIGIAVPPAEAYSVVGKSLVEAGYTFRTEKEFLIFKTDERPLPREPAFQFSSVITIADGRVTCRGSLRNTVKMNIGMASVEGPPFAVEYRNGGMSIPGKGFAELDKMAKAIAAELNGTLAYKFR